MPERWIVEQATFAVSRAWYWRRNYPDAPWHGPHDTEKDARDSAQAESASADR